MPVTVEGQPGWYLDIDTTAVPYIWDAARRAEDGEAVDSIVAGLNAREVPTPLDRARMLLQHKPRLCLCGYDAHSGPCESFHKCRQRLGTTGRRLHAMDDCSQPCPAYQPRRWDRESMVRLLRSPTLLGYAVEGGKPPMDDDGRPVQFSPGVLTLPAYQKLQARLDKRKTTPVRMRTDSMLLGIAFCDCGTALYRTSVCSLWGGNQHYYKYYRERPGAGCKAKQLLCGPLDGLVTREMLGHVGHYEILQKEEPTARRAEIEAELRTVNAQLVQLFQERLEGNERDNHRELNDQLEARRAELKAALDSEAAPQPVLVPTGHMFHERWDAMTAPQRRMWMLDTGVRVTAVRGRNVKAGMPGGPLVGEDIPRSILASDGDLHAVIDLGGMAALLRRVSAA